VLTPGEPRGRLLQLAGIAIGAAAMIALTYFGLQRLLGDCDCGAASRGIGGAVMLLSAAALLPVTIATFAHWLRRLRR
jgi:ABC-type antimicrobial peptide transport system permease subunit